MRKIYRINCKEYKEFKNPRISNICYNALPLFSISNKCGSEDKKIFKAE